MEEKTDATTPAGATTPKPPKTKPLRATRPTKTTPRLLAARELQGQYLGLLRRFTGAHRERVRTVARKSGIAAAVAEMKTLLDRG